MKKHLLEKIYEEMASDTDGDSRQSARLERLYQEAGPTGKWHIDETMMCLCGWTMKTLIENLDKSEEKIVYIDGYWRDTKASFEGYKCKLSSDVGEEDDDIFYYFDSEGDLKSFMEDQVRLFAKGTEEFVITRFYFEDEIDETIDAEGYSVKP